MRRLLLSAALLWSSLVSAERLTIDRIFGSPDLAGPSPRALKIAPDGRHVAYLRGRADDQDQLDLWLYDVAGGKARRVVDSTSIGERRELSDAEKARRERERIAQLKGIVAYENPGYVLPDTIEPKAKEGPFGPLYVSEAEFMRFTKVPIQLVWGDHMEDSKVWVGSYAQAELFAKEVNKRGGHVEMLHLTDAGLHGNTHIPFADMNNDEVAKLLFKWLKKNGFQ